MCAPRIWTVRVWAILIWTFFCFGVAFIPRLCIFVSRINTFARRGGPKSGTKTGSLRSQLWSMATRCARLFGSSLRSTFGGLDVFVYLAARFARLSADSLCSCLWQLASLDFRRTQCARLFGGSIRSTFGGLAVLVSLAARFARLSAGSLCSCLWRIASLDCRRTRCAGLVGGSLRSTFGGLDVLVSLVARFARLSADSL